MQKKRWISPAATSSSSSNSLRHAHGAQELGGGGDGIEECSSDSDEDDIFGMREPGDPKPSFPELSQTFWTVADLKRADCSINFKDYRLDAPSAHEQQKKMDARRKKNEKKTQKKEAKKPKKSSGKNATAGKWGKNRWAKKK